MQMLGKFRSSGMPASCAPYAVDAKDNGAKDAQDLIQHLLKSTRAVLLTELSCGSSLQRAPSRQQTRDLTESTTPQMRWVKSKKIETLKG